MIHTLVHGILLGAPEVRVSASGADFATARIRVENATREGMPGLVSIIAFNEAGERLAGLGSGAAISVAGRATLSAWLDKKSAKPRAGLSIVVDQFVAITHHRDDRAPGRHRDTGGDAMSP